MKPIVEKVLKSGVIDQSMAELMEKYQLIPAGASELVQETTQKQMEKLVEEVVEMAEREAIVKETRLDFEKLRWPVSVQIVAAQPGFDRSPFLDAVIDRMGRYFFRFQDVKEEWFVPGFVIVRKVGDGVSKETILESQVLYIDETPVAIQVTTRAS